MSTLIRPELSKENPYYISKHRYYELTHFCLQYHEWKELYLSLDVYNHEKTENYTDPTPHLAMVKMEQIDKMKNLIDIFYSLLNKDSLVDFENFYKGLKFESIFQYENLINPIMKGFLYLEKMLSRVLKPNHLNEFYKFLGLETTDYGDTVGWDVCSEIYWIDFSHRKAIIGDDHDGFECCIIEMPYYPRKDYMDQYD